MWEYILKMHRPLVCLLLHFQHVIRSVECLLWSSSEDWKFFPKFRRNLFTFVVLPISQIVLKFVAIFKGSGHYW